MDYSKVLLKCKDIYPPEWVKGQIDICIHWNGLTEKERERKLCHDMCVFLLCNTKKGEQAISLSEQIRYQSSGSRSAESENVTTSDVNFETGTFQKFIEEEMKNKKLMEAASTATINIIAESRKRELEQSTSSNKRIKDETESEQEGSDDNSEGMEDIDYNYDSDHFYDPMEAVSEEVRDIKEKEHVGELIGANEMQYEYLPLESMSSSKEIVATLSRLWGVRTVWNFDIADMRNNNFIEVKTTTRKIEECYLEEWGRITEQFDEVSTAIKMIIISLNSEKGKIISYFHCETSFKMPGHELVEDFIIRRKLKLVEVSQTYPREDEASKSLFDHPILCKSLKDWMKPLKESHQPYMKEKPKTVDLNEMSLEEILKLLTEDDPKKRKLPSSKWSGKMLPYTWTKTIESNKSLTDLEMSIEIMKEMEIMDYKTINWEEEKGASLLNSIKQMTKVFFDKEDDGTLNNFNFIDTRKKKNGTYSTDIEDNIEDLLKNLGIGMKKTSYKATSSGMKQPDYKPIPKRSFDDWMSSLMKAECSHDDYTSTIKDLKEDIESKHPIGEFSKRVCNYILSVFQFMNAAKTSSKVINLYSRLGGSYLINLDKTKRSTHSSISFFPLYSNCVNKNKEECKLVSGILIRGPQHVRDSSDKIGYLTIEKIRKGLNYNRKLEKGILIAPSRQFNRQLGQFKLGIF